MNTEIATKEEMTKKMVDYITEYIPKIHQESLKLMIQENENLLKMIKEADLKIVNLRDTNTAQFNTIERLDTDLSELKKTESDNKIKAAELAKGLAEVARKKELRAHEVKISELELLCANQKTTIIKECMEVVFKPAALRTEIQKQIPMHQNFFTSEYDNQGKSIYIKTGEGAVLEHAVDKKIVTDE